MNTNIVASWKDVTSYSRDSIERTPTCHAIEHDQLRISVTCGHIYHRGEWVMHCRQLGIDTKLLKAKNLSDAKAEAVRVVGAKIKAFHHNYEHIFDATL